MLHGSIRRYCNVTHVHSMVKKGVADNSVDVDAAPTEDDLREADAKAGPNTLMQIFVGQILQKVLYFSTMDQIYI